MTRDAKDFLDKPVIATASGTQIGSVDHLLFEPGKHLLYGLVVKPSQDSEPQRFVTRENIKSVGHDAITVEDESRAEIYEADEHARELSSVGGHLKKTPIMTEKGDELGKVDGIVLNEDHSIAAYKWSSGLFGLSSKEVASADVIVAGPDAIVVPEPVQEQRR